MCLECLHLASSSVKLKLKWKLELENQNYKDTLPKSRKTMSTRSKDVTENWKLQDVSQMNARIINCKREKMKETRQELLISFSDVMTFWTWKIFLHFCLVLFKIVHSSWQNVCQFWIYLIVSALINNMLEFCLSVCNFLLLHNYEIWFFLNS